MKRLTTLLVAGLVLVPAAAWAIDDYPYPTAPSCCNNSCTADEWGFYKRECTSFVSWRMNNTNGVSFYNCMPGPSGAGNCNNRWTDAGNWSSHAVELGYTVNTTPAVGAIAQWNVGECTGCSVGHVAWVQAVHTNGTVDVEEYNFSVSCGYSRRTSITAPRYIHVADISGGAPYQCAWVANSPPQTAVAGQMLNLFMRYRNTGTEYWTNNQNESDPHSVELWSCNSNGTIVDSWFEPVDWVGCPSNCSDWRVTGADQTQINPNGTATFTFQARVPSTATPGSYPIYFRPTHGSQLMEDWGDANIVVNVVTSDPCAGGPCPGRYIPNNCLPQPGMCCPNTASSLRNLPDATPEQWARMGLPTGLRDEGTYSVGFEYRATTATELSVGFASFDRARPPDVVGSVSPLTASTDEWRPFWSAPFELTAQQIRDLPNLRLLAANRGSIEFRNVQVLRTDRR